MFYVYGFDFSDMFWLVSIVLRIYPYWHEEVIVIQPQSFPRLPTTSHIHPFLPQTVSQGHTHVPPRRIQKIPYQGFWCSEVHVLRLRIRFVGQELACVHGDGFCSCFLTWVCFFNDSRRSSFHTFLFVSFS